MWMVSYCYLLLLLLLPFADSAFPLIWCLHPINIVFAFRKYGVYRVSGFSRLVCAANQE